MIAAELGRLSGRERWAANCRRNPSAPIWWADSRQAATRSGRPAAGPRLAIACSSTTSAKPPGAERARPAPTRSDSWSSDARAAAAVDQHQVTDPLWRPANDLQGHDPAQRMSDQSEPVGRLGQHRLGHPGHGVVEVDAIPSDGQRRIHFLHHAVPESAATQACREGAPPERSGLFSRHGAQSPFVDGHPRAVVNSPPSAASTL